MGPIRMLLIGAPGSEFRRAAELAQSAGAEVTMADAPGAALETLRAHGADLVMIDVLEDVAGFLGDLRSERFVVPVLACGISAPAERAVAAIRAGARDYVPLPPQRELIAAAIASVVERQSQVRIGGNAVLDRAMALAAAVAPSGAPVLVTGGKGSGKEMMAREIHRLSSRPDPIVSVECAGVGADVLESELFGHEAGAFPGAAARRVGRLESARGGTIFLREVGALAPATQARLLAALIEKRFKRLGGEESVPFEARLIASTSMDLELAVEAGSFREDLLVRLSLARLEVPPLAEHGGDIAALAHLFIAQFAQADGLPARPLADDAIVVLRAYGWPGNIRELKECIHRASLLAHGPRIEAEDLTRSDGSPLEALVQLPAADGRIEVNSLIGRTVEEVERELILGTLERCHGNRTSASSILGISVRTMRNKLRTFIEGGIAVPPAA
jgi:two-component system response regulator HydG